DAPTHRRHRTFQSFRPIVYGCNVRQAAARNHRRHFGVEDEASGVASVQARTVASTSGDSFRQPLPYLVLKPTHGANTSLDSLWESAPQPGARKSRSGQVLSFCKPPSTEEFAAEKPSSRQPGLLNYHPFRGSYLSISFRAVNG